MCFKFEEYFGFRRIELTCVACTTLWTILYYIVNCFSPIEIMRLIDWLLLILVQTLYHEIYWVPVVTRNLSWYLPNHPNGRCFPKHSFKSQYRTHCPHVSRFIGLNLAESAELSGLLMSCIILFNSMRLWQPKRGFTPSDFSYTMVVVLHISHNG